MMRKYVALLLSLVLLLSGCSLALEEGEQAGRDRLIGVFVTTDSIYHEVHSDNNPAAGEDRLYAQLVPSSDGRSHEYIFDLDGYYFYSATIAPEGQDPYVSSGGGEGISDAHMSHHYKDEGYEVTMEGTIYFLSGTDLVIYANPIYQTAEGEVYLVQGNGMGLSFGESAYRLNESVETDVEGEESYSIDLELTYKALDEICSVTVLAMSEDNNILVQNTYEPGAVPDQITPEQGTAYYLVQTQTIDQDGNPVTQRQLVTSDDRCFDTYVLNDEGIYLAQSTQIAWEN